MIPKDYKSLGKLDCNYNKNKDYISFTVMKKKAHHLDNLKSPDGYFNYDNESSPR